MTTMKGRMRVLCEQEAIVETGQATVGCSMEMEIEVKVEVTRKQQCTGYNGGMARQLCSKAAQEIRVIHKD